VLPIANIIGKDSATFCEGSSVVLHANTGMGLSYQWKKDGSEILGSSATDSSYTVSIVGSYIVSVTDSNNCSATSSPVLVTESPIITPTFKQVRPYASGTAIPSLPTTSNDGIRGTWSPAINNTATTTYTFSPSQGECATSTTMIIKIEEPLKYTLTASDNSVCAGTTVTLSVNIPSTYPAGTVHCNGTPTAIVDVTNPVTGKTWMDRNLGASQAATSSTDAAAYGDLYQWGRGADGHQCRNSATTTALSSSDQPGHGDFILTSALPFDWRNPQNTNLWQGVNGVNNPCPSGYRLPTRTEFGYELVTWISDDAIGAFKSIGLTMAGGRLNDDGSILYVGTFGAYWYSTISGNNGITSSGLGFNTSSSYPNDNYRSIGRTVRCIKY
jgi:hypothetical protein